MAKCPEKVTVCNTVKIDDTSIISALNNLTVAITGPVTVEPSAAWEAMFTAALEAADIALDAETLAALENITVTIDTADGPVEVTGTVNVAQDGSWTVSVDNFPDSISIDNFDEIGTLNINIAGQDEPLEVSISDEVKGLLGDITSAIKEQITVDWEPTGMCVFGPDGQPLSPPVKQFQERKYTYVGNLLSSTAVLSVFNPNGTISGYTLQRGQTIAPCTTEDCVLLGTLNRVILPETGIEVHHWFEVWEEGEEGAGNAVPHGTISDTFPNGVHASGQPADSVVTNTNWSFNDAVGAVGQGASQTYAIGDVYFPSDGYFNDINNNTGEYVVVKIDGVVVSTNFDLTDGALRGGFIKPISVTKGKHTIEVFISDVSVFGGAGLVFSETLAGDFAALPAYKLGTVKCECVKVEKCNGIFRNCVTGEIVEIGPNDEWADCLIVNELAAIKKKLNECCDKENVTSEPCPKLIVSDPVNIDTGDSAPFPYVAGGDRGIAEFTQMLSIECEECIGDEVVIRVTEDHEATPYDTHRGYINVTSAGTFTLSGPTNTFETASATGNGFLGIGYARGDAVNGPRAVRVYEITVPKEALCDTLTLSTRGFGGVGGVTETIYNRTFEIVGGLENCNGC